MCLMMEEKGVCVYGVALPLQKNTYTPITTKQAARKPKRMPSSREREVMGV